MDASRIITEFWRWTADFSRRRARMILTGVGLITIGLCPFLLRLESDTDLDSFIRPAARELTQTIEDDFEEGGMLILVFEALSGRSLLDPEILHQQLRIIRTIQQSYDVTTYSLVEGIDAGLKRVKRKSLLDYHDYSPIAEAILALAGGRTVRDLEKLSRHYVSHPEAIAFYTKFRIAGTLGAVPQGPGAKESRYQIPFIKAIKAHVRLDPRYARPERKHTLAGIRDLARSLATPDLAVYALNDQLVAHELDERSAQNALALGLAVVLVDGLCVWALFRSRRELLVVFIVLATSCIWSFSVAGALGLRFSFFHLVALPILLGTGIDDCLVFGRRFGEEREKGEAFDESLRATFKGTGTAIFLTTFTTMIAFFASVLTATTEIVFSFFLLVALSMLVLFLMSTFLQGALRAELDRHNPWRSGPGSLASTSLFTNAAASLARLSCAAMNRPRLVLLVSSALLVVAVSSAGKLKSEMHREDFMRPGLQGYAANQVLNDHLHDTKVGYVLLEGDVENPLLLDKMRRLKQRLIDHPTIEQILGEANIESILDLMDKQGITITSRTSVRAAIDRLSQNERTADYVLDMSYREASRHWVRKNADGYDGLLMRFFTRGSEGGQVVNACRAIVEQIKSLGFDEIPGVRVRVGGGDVAFSLESAHYVELLTNSFLLSLVANALVLQVCWRRLRLTLIALVPMVLAVTLVVGLMALLGVRLTLLNVATGAVAVGLGIDYPVHISERFKEERRGGRDRRLAAERALITMGPHMLAGALTTVVGFSAACILGMPLAVSFGLLTGGGITLVYLASIFLLPLLLVRYGRPEQAGPRPLNVIGRKIADSEGSRSVA